jgi:light-regulated signal transduction histidine kinase (bacteriophytochrome)
VQDGGPAVPVPTRPLDHSGVSRYERILIAKDGRRIPAEIDTRFFRYQGRPMVMSLIRDITARKHAEEQIARLYREAQGEIERRKELEVELRRANEDLQEFTSAIAHDLQSPLSGVASVVELMTEEWGGRLGPDADWYTLQIRKGLDRMRNMILDLLDYAHVGHGDQQEHALIAPGKVLEHVRLNLAARIQETGAVITHDVLPEVEGNFASWVQLFQNLIENAIKYRSEEPPWIHISSKRTESERTFCVSDNGIGIAPRYAEEIFGVFKRLSSEYEGTGIGLSLCKKIVERQGGRIWVESRPGEGARFYFVIPMGRRVEHTGEDRTAWPAVAPPRAQGTSASDPGRQPS